MENASRLVVTYLLNACWQLPLVAALALLGSWAIRRAPSQYRHALWVTALVVGALLPLQSVGRTLLGAGSTPSGVWEKAAVAAPSATGPSTDTGFWFGLRRHSWAITPTPRLVVAIASIYLLFLGYRIVRFAWALRYTMQVRKYAYERELPPNLRAVAERCRASFAASGPSILCSDHVHGPATLQFEQALLILPARFFEQVTEEDFASALCHEMAHIARHDFLWNLLYELLYLPVSFHPAAVLIRQRIDRTRELACDERASEALATRAGYADSLLNLAHLIAGKAHPASSTYALGLFDSNVMEDRIMNLLSKTHRTSKRVGRILAVSASTLLLTACFGAAAFSFQVVRAASNSSDVRPFVGTWEGQFQGHTFVVLKLHEENGQLAGTAMHTTSLAENDQGELTKVGDKNVPGKIVESRISGKSVVITIADDANPANTASFEFKVTGPGEGEMNPVHQPQNKIVTKPWKMKRTTASL